MQDPPARRASPRSARPPRTALQKAALASWLSVVRSYHLCDAVVTRRMSEIGVRTAEYEILGHLRREPGLTQQQLAQRCFQAKSHISALLKSMEEDGWVRRVDAPGDARAWNLHLTPAGETVAERTLRVQAEIIDGMCDTETAEDLNAVQAAMERVGARLEAMLASADAARRGRRAR